MNRVRLTRRAAFRWALAAGAVGALWGGSRVVKNIAAELERQRLEIEARQREPPILTRSKQNPNPVSLKEIIEKWPDVRVKEMFWYKQHGKPGQVRRGDLVRTKNTVVELPALPGDRSYIHTHPMGFHELPPHLHGRIYSRLSEGDIAMLADRFLGENFPQVQNKGNNIRTSHVAVVNELGNVIGYYSMRLSKRLTLREIMDLRDSFTDASRRIGMMIGGERWGAVEKMLNDTRDKVEEYCKARKLFVHVTPMPGFVYKDGYFQPKK